MPSKSNKPTPQKKQDYFKLIFVWVILLALLFSILAFPILLTSRVAGEEADEPRTEGPSLPAVPDKGLEENQAGHVTPPTEASPSPAEETDQRQENLTDPDQPLGPEAEDPGQPLATDPEVLDQQEHLEGENWTLDNPPLLGKFEAEEDRISILLPLDPYTDYLPAYVQALNCNPLISNSPYLFCLASLLYRPLYAEGDQAAYSLLDSYDLSADGQSLHLKLKPQLNWADKQPLTTRDIEFTLDCLIQAQLAYPRDNFLAKIVGVETGLEAAGNASAYQPFIRLEGIEALNDQEMILSFTENISPDLEDILALPILPARVWWSAAPQDWLQLASLPLLYDQDSKAMGEGEVIPPEDNPVAEVLSPQDRQAIYAAAGSGPYCLDFQEDSPDLNFTAKPALPGSPFPQAQVPRLSIRHSRNYEIVDDLLTYEADLAMLPLVTPEDQARILQAGYKLDKLATSSLVSLSINSDLEENPLTQPDVLAALYLLAPQGNAMQELTQVPILATQGECLNSTGQTSLGQRIAAATAGPTGSPEERRDLAWELLLKAGYTTPKMPEEVLAKAGNQVQSLGQVGLSIFYLGDDRLTHDCVLAWDANLMEAGIDINFQTISQEDLNSKLALEPSGLVLNGDRSMVPPTWPAYSLYQQACYFASKRVENFSPQAPYYFLGAENWTLPQSKQEPSQEN
ncbi:MAG: ABC transporter substrate-binding protein [Eubacteriales bacterium]|nr:ABC transporter substrate-binding protein [Clostridiales bacterium]MDY5836017.1 ABC transporter substrate-binding protein [Eubacteriales bacterium]